MAASRKPKEGETLPIAKAEYNKISKLRPAAELVDRRFLFHFGHSALLAIGPFEAFERPEGSGSFWIRSADGTEFGSCTRQQMSEFLVRKDLGEDDVLV